MCVNLMTTNECSDRQSPYSVLTPAAVRSPVLVFCFQVLRVMPVSQMLCESGHMLLAGLFRRAVDCGKEGQPWRPYAVPSGAPIHGHSCSGEAETETCLVRSLGKHQVEYGLQQDLLGRTKHLQTAIHDCQTSAIDDLPPKSCVGRELGFAIVE